MQDSASDRTLIDVRFDHTIIPAQDARESAEFFSEIFGLPSPVQVGFFQQVRLSDGRIIDFAEPRSDFPGQHYAFLVNEHTFDRVVGLLRDWQRDHWADPQQSQPGQINTNHGGRGVYFLDPSGHYLEALTARYDGTDLS
jgi:catechol 2,3-dioxygenase-like lactoylglutathione lyase family enzyme